MAVSGADWRKPTDGYWMDTSEKGSFVHPEVGAVSAALDSETVESRAVVRTLADNTDNDECVDIRNTVGADDTTGFNPLAIEGTLRHGVVPERSIDHTDCVNPDAPETGYAPSKSRVGGNDFSLRYFILGPTAQGDAVIVE